MKNNYKHKKINTVSFMSNGGLYAGYYKELTCEEFYFDVKKSFEVQREVYEEYDCDDKPYIDLPYGEILDLGGELNINLSSRVEIPRVKRYPINSIEEALSYKLPPIEEREFTKLKCNFFEYATSKGNKNISISGGSPFTIMGYLMNPNLFIRWIVEEEEIIKHLLNIIMQYLSETADILIGKFGIENCAVHTNYPFESNNLISPQDFKKYSLPSTLKMNDIMRSKGLKEFSIHICGNHMKNLEYFKELKLASGSFISCDHLNDINTVISTLGDKYLYAGNISAKLLALSSPEEVYNESIKLIEEVSLHNCDFILMPSCDLPINAKSENIHSMRKAVKESNLELNKF